MKVNFLSRLPLKLRQFGCCLCLGLIGANQSYVSAQDGVVVPAGRRGFSVVRNGRGDTISAPGADATAVRVEARALVNNSGTISGGLNGVDFVNGLGSGLLFNNRSGVITSDSRAVNIGGNVQLFNFGKILGTDDQRNATVYSDSVATRFSILNHGVIDTGEGNQGAGVGLEIERTDARIINSGVIQGRTNTPNVAGNSPASGDGLRLNNFGPLAEGEERVFRGLILNLKSGRISSESESGPIAGLRVANTVGFQGRIINIGQIDGPRNGLYFGEANHDRGRVINIGNISSGSRALNIDGTGLVVENIGQIVGEDDQRNGTVYADSTAQNFTLINRDRAVVDAGEGNLGAGFSVELSELGNDFEIENFGQFVGRGDAGAGAPVAGDGMRFERARVDGLLGPNTVGLFSGNVENNGSITSEGANGTVAGVRFVNGVSFQGFFVNGRRGVISGPQNGFYFGNPVPAGGADHTDGTVINEGTISSDSRAFNLDGIGLTVQNEGQILATGAQRNGTFYVDGTGTEFTIINQRRASIDASGGRRGEGSGSGISMQIGVTDELVGLQTGAITNRGLIAGSGEQPIDAGVRLFAPEAGDVFSGEILNASSGVISADAAPAILVEDGVDFQGVITNEGLILGAVSLSTGDLVLSNRSRVVLDVVSPFELEQISVGGSVELGGEINLNFAVRPAAGEVFQIVDADNIVGRARVRANGVRLDTSNLAIDGTVTVVR